MSVASDVLARNLFIAAAPNAVAHSSTTSRNSELGIGFFACHLHTMDHNRPPPTGKTQEIADSNEKRCTSYNQ